MAAAMAMLARASGPPASPAMTAISADSTIGLGLPKGRMQ